MFFTRRMMEYLEGKKDNNFYHKFYSDIDTNSELIILSISKINKQLNKQFLKEE